MRTITLADGKYGVDRDERGLIVDVRRNGEPWEKGFELIAYMGIFHAALDRIEELEARLSAITRRICCDRP